MTVYKEQENKFLSERKIADILTVHLERLGYIVVKELVLNNSLFDIKALTKRDISKVRIDVAAYKDGKGKSQRPEREYDGIVRGRILLYLPDPGKTKCD